MFNIHLVYLVHSKTYIRMYVPAYVCACVLVLYLRETTVAYAILGITSTYIHIIHMYVRMYVCTYICAYTANYIRMYVSREIPVFHTNIYCTVIDISY